MSQSTPQQAPSAGSRILIVDDEAINRELLESLVEAFGHTSETAADGNEALARLTPRIDLVLLDAMMPGMDGFEVARRIRAHPELGQTPIIMATALTSKEDRLRAVEAGANDFVTKPIDRTELKVRMASLLKMKEAQDAILRQQQELHEKNEELHKQNQRMQADLNLAREIQQSFLPRQYPSFPHTVAPDDSALHFCHRWIPTTTLGGDFFDVLALSDTEAGVFISDVMGHGVRSALVTAMMRALVGERTTVVREPGIFLGEINRHLMSILQQTRTAMFASAFYLIINTESGAMRYANAGHPSPLWIRRRLNMVQALPRGVATGPALGVLEDARYATAHCQLAPRDVVMLFTDGLFEVEGADGEYGEDRLLSAVRQRAGLTPEALFDEVLADIRQFAGSNQFEDDVCLLGVEVAPEVR